MLHRKKDHDGGKGEQISLYLVIWGGGGVEPNDVELGGGFIKGILSGVRGTKLLRGLFLHRRPPSWTTLVLYSRAEPVFVNV